MSDTLILIPARLNSTRLPRKPLLDINGKTMIQHVYEQAVASDIADVYVACSEEEVKNKVEKFGGKAILTDPELPSGSDRIYAALQQIEGNEKYKYILNLQGDVPNIEPQILKDMINAMVKTPEADIITPVTLIHDKNNINNPNIVKAVVAFEEDNPIAKTYYFTRAAAPYGEGNYYEHIGVYLYKRSVLEQFVTLPVSQLEKREKLEQLRCLENNITIYSLEVSQKPISVDTREDLERARRVIK
jgi:3-deoxy-manno-octulosonate cytidylyltransferase (CMP-KDO synthetase)